VDKPFPLEIITRQRAVLRADVSEVVVPGSEGYLGVWAGHAPLLTALTVGVVHVRFPDGERERIAVTGGFAEIGPDKVIVLAESAERAEEIDQARAEAALRRAEERLAAGEFPDVDSERARMALARALNRLKTLKED
jgi:F-type H+-transporting ATPase subunit epsilon